ncbi:MAG: hypothetical protein QM765_25805 [Myxococcales bacterium]
MPVFPLVASRMILSRVSPPVRSASLIIHSAMRSLMDPPGLVRSSLARICTLGFGQSERMG